MSAQRKRRGVSCSRAPHGGRRLLRRPTGKRVWHSRPLLEVVPRDQPFVYHSPDHPALQSPLPVQHPPSLEQFLLQLLQGRKMLIRRSSRTATQFPPHLRLWPINPISGEIRGLVKQRERSHRVTVRGRLIFPPGAPMADPRCWPEVCASAPSRVRRGPAPQPP